MININDLIMASNSNTKDERELIRDRKVEETYKQYPELEKIDKEIVAARTAGFIAVLDGNEVEERHNESLLRQLKEKRERCLGRYDIPSDFDEEKIICTRCNDTGFFKNKNGLRQVCPCRNDDLEECYRISGMRDYSSIRTDNYSDDYFGNKDHRKILRRKMLDLVLGNEDLSAKPLWVLFDGTQTGKTFLSVYVLKLAINLGKSVYYTKLDEFMMMDRDTIDDIRDVDLLVVDDYVANMTMTGMTGTRLNALLESRQAMGLATVIVTSFPIQNLIEESDSRISGKIQRAGIIKHDKGSDRK
ncbi:MAG: hypothetical protein K6A80_00400 [Saccharofermentans sp.]|nr:hypothetical protein [Saccharofermentans sp.]